MSQTRIWSLALVALVCTVALAQKPNPATKKTDAKAPLARHVTNVYGQALTKSPLMLSRDPAQTVWRVFYATNRVRLVNEKDLRTSYGPVPASPPRLDYGECEVVLPIRPFSEAEQRTDGPIEKARQVQEHPKVVSCREVQPTAYNRFFEELVRAVSQSPQRDVLIYVHGYNTQFEDAVCRAGQLAQDMPFNGVVICYSWPSAGSSFSYTKDVENADGTVKHFWRFLSALHTHLGNGTRINLLAHGLGCRALLQGVASMPKNIREVRPFQHLVLAAPDIAVDKFPVWADKCSIAVRNMTVYVSQTDEALVAAKNYARQSQSVGDPSKLVIVPQVDTIDVSGMNRNVLNFSYGAGNKTMLNELFQVIKLDNPPARRSWLKETKHDGKVYWQFANENLEAVQAERPTLKK